MMFPTIRTAAAGLLLTFALAACGSGVTPSGVSTLQSPNTGPGGSAQPSASLSPEDAQLAFSQCMREHGVDVPDPVAVGPGGQSGGFGAVPIGGPNTDPAKLQPAMEACQSLLGQSFGLQGGAADPAQLDNMVKFAGCMREHGIDLPDPDSNGNTTFGGPSSSGVPGGNLDPSSPQFQAASEACRSFLGVSGASEAPATARP